MNIERAAGVMDMAVFSKKRLVLDINVEMSLASWNEIIAGDEKKRKEMEIYHEAQADAIMALIFRHVEKLPIVEAWNDVPVYLKVSVRPYFEY